MSNTRHKFLGILFFVLVSLTSWVILAVILLYGMREFVKALMAIVEIANGPR